MHTDNDINRLGDTIIGRAFIVQNALGCGFLEKVYENALAHELRKVGLVVAQQHDIAVHYDGVIAGKYAVDLVVENRLLIELKAVRVLDAMHQAQCLNYLKATGFWLCLLLNFGSPRLEIKRLSTAPNPDTHGLRLG
jgi:GxxExxY protein